MAYGKHIGSSPELSTGQSRRPTPAARRRKPAWSRADEDPAVCHGSLDPLRLGLNSVIEYHELVFTQPGEDLTTSGRNKGRIASNLPVVFLVHVSCSLLHLLDPLLYSLSSHSCLNPWDDVHTGQLHRTALL